MNEHFIIDAHEDLSYESLYGKFDYTRSVADNRRFNQGPEKFQSIIGWPELQNGQIGLVFGTIFNCPPDAPEATSVPGETYYRNGEEFHRCVTRHFRFYHELAERHPDQFRLVKTKADYQEVIQPWLEHQAHFPEITHPVGIAFLLEGAEGLRSFEDLDTYYAQGLRMIGPVWGGGRWCAGTRSHIKDELTAEGRELLRHMEAKGFGLDISHMKNHSAMDAMQTYSGTIFASHVNCDALVQGLPVERHFKDETIRELAAHDGAMGVIPYNSFLDAAWWQRTELPRNTVTLDTLANHIDHICQLTGSSRHAAIGTDADGGFGYPQIPEEMNDIHDIQKLAAVLEKRGFTAQDIRNVFHENWQRILERNLP